VDSLGASPVNQDVFWRKAMNLTSVSSYFLLLSLKFGDCQA
jgi:hypothetical protein